MKYVLLAAMGLASLSINSAAHAQSRIVTTCGALSPFGADPPGNQAKPTMDPNGNTCISGSFSATATVNGFTPSASPRMTPMTVLTSDTSIALPTGAATVVSNVGANPMYCNVSGVAATTADQLIAASSWFAFTIPAGGTVLHCIATGGSTTATGLGGSGLATGAGGGGGGGAGGSNASVGTTGSAVPGSGTYAAMNVGGTLTGMTGTANGLKVDATATTQPISAASLPLPATASTQALQTTGNNSLSTIITTLGSPFQAAGSIGNTGFNTLVAGTPESTSNPHVTRIVDAASNAATVTPGGNLNIQCANCSGSGVSVTDGAIFAAGSSVFAPAGGVYETTPTTIAGPSKSGEAGLTAYRGLKVNLNTSAGVETGVAAAPLQVSLANTATNATAVKVDGTGGSFPSVVTNAGTFAVQLTGATNNINNISGTISLPTNAATQTAQNTGNTSLSTLVANSPALGQAAMAASTPVAIANNQSAIPTTLTGTTNNINNITGTVSLPTNAATQTAQNTGNNTLATLALESGGNLASIKTDVDALNYPFPSTTSGQKGNLNFGAVTTAAPSYSTGQSNPLSLTPTGALRVDGSGATQPVSQSGAFLVNQGNAGASPWPVTANAGTNLDTHLLALESGGNLAAIKADVDNLNIPQGSTASTQKGNLGLASVVSTAPTYVNGQASPPTLTTAGETRVACTTGCSATAGTQSNASSNVATSTNNGQVVGWMYGFNGSTWDQVRTMSNASSAVATTTANNLSNVSFNYGFNGASWDQLQVDASKNLKVTETNSAALLSAATAPIPAGTNVIGSLTANQSVNVAQIAGATILTGNGGNGGAQRVVIATDNAAYAVSARPTAFSTGGATDVSNIAPANTTAVVVKATQGTLYGVQLGGVPTAPVYVKFYNNSSACTGTPVKRLIVPVASTAANGAGSNVTFPVGIAFSAGITYCATTDITDTNSGAPTANTVLINVDYN